MEVKASVVEEVHSVMSHLVASNARERNELLKEIRRLKKSLRKAEILLGRKLL